MVIVVEVISTGVLLVVKLIIVVEVDGLVETVVVVLVVVVGLFVVFLARQQRQGPCPGNGSHLPALQLSSSTTMSCLAVTSSTHTWPGRVEQSMSWQFWQQIHGISRPGGRVPGPGSPIIGGNSLGGDGEVHSCSSVQTPSPLLIWG